MKNVLVVRASDPFATLPPPVAGVITLPTDTFVEICGDVDVGNNVLELPSSSVLGGKDPAVDSVTSSAGQTVRSPEGGTIKDLGVRNTAPVGTSSQCVVVGSIGGFFNTAVLFNLALANPTNTGVLFFGDGVLASCARVSKMDGGTCYQFGERLSGGEIKAVSIETTVTMAGLNNPSALARSSPAFTLGSAAFLSCASNYSDPASFGIELLGPTGVLRVASCAYLAVGTPSIVAQPAPFPPATVGSAVQAESVGCVGYDNSQQTGSIQVRGAITPIPAPGVFVPVGTAATPLYVLAPSSVRVSVTGATTNTQTLVFNRFSPYSAEITVALSVAVAAGFTFTPRVVSARIVINGVPQDSFEGTTPDFTSAAPASITFDTPALLSAGDTVQLEIANLTDNAPLEVITARLTIT